MSRFEVGDLVMLNIDYKNTFTIRHMIRKFGKNAIFTIFKNSAMKNGDMIYEVEEINNFSFKGEWLLGLSKLSKEDKEDFLGEELFLV